MAALDSYIEIDTTLLLDAEESEDDTEEYYKSMVSELRKIPLSELGHCIRHDIAITCFSTKSFPTDWKSVVEPLLKKNNIDVNITLAEIEASADVKKVLPLYEALGTKLTMIDQSVGKLIEVLLELDLLHVLRKIRDGIEDLLRDFQRKRTIPQKQNELYQEKCMHVCEKIPTSKQIVRLPNDHLNVLIPQKQNELYQEKCMRVSKKINTSKQVVCLPNDPLNVFIPHTNKVCEIARKFSADLRDQYNVQARAMCEIQHLLPIDSRGILDTVLSNVDFVLPIISTDYLNIVRVAHDLLNEDERRNRYVYTWLGNEYESNACLNFRCRGIVVDGVNVMDVQRIPLFYNCFRLTDVQRIIDHLYCTKKDMPILMKKLKCLQKIT